MLLLVAKKRWSMQSGGDTGAVDNSGGETSSMKIMDTNTSHHTCMKC